MKTQMPSGRSSIQSTISHANSQMT
ncbi:unnamed protein product [Linum tenue]|uniref:Uncharacterized protein n=1 Tax=Linum tenue TaxID=586396 RepID=A0AAV0H624_9ROSI|nr:unnamed protein product [Linum tenue]